MASRTRTRKATLIQRSRRVPAVEKAVYHDVLGAGRSTVKRPFFGLSAADETALTERLDQGLQRNLDKGSA